MSKLWKKAAATVVATGLLIMGTAAAANAVTTAPASNDTTASTSATNLSPDYSTQKVAVSNSNSWISGINSDGSLWAYNGGYFSATGTTFPITGADGKTFTSVTAFGSGGYFIAQASDGSLWEYNPGGSRTAMHITGADGTVALVTAYNYMYGIGSDGHIWWTQASETAGSVSATPVTGDIANHTFKSIQAYSVNANVPFAAIAADGTVWTGSYTGTLFQTPDVTGSIAATTLGNSQREYGITSDGRLWSYDIANGSTGTPSYYGVTGNRTFESIGVWQTGLVAAASDGTLWEQRSFSSTTLIQAGASIENAKDVALTLPGIYAADQSGKLWYDFAGSSTTTSSPYAVPTPVAEKTFSRVWGSQGTSWVGVATDGTVWAGQTGSGYQVPGATADVSTTVAEPTVGSFTGPTPDASGTYTAKGTGVPGSTVTIKDADGNTVATATTNSDGNWEASVPTSAKSPLAITQTVNGNTSDPLEYTITVPQPEVTSLEGTSGDYAMKGTGVAGSTITVKDASGNTIGTATTNSDGTWQVAVPANATSPLAITQTIGANTSSPLEYTISSVAEPTVTSFTGPTPDANGNYTAKGTGIAGSTVTIKDAAGNTVATATTSADGTWEASVPTSAKSPLAITQTVNGTTSNPLEYTVVVAQPAITSVEGPATNGNYTMKGTGVDGSTVTVKDASGNTVGTATTNNEGVWEVVIPAGTTAPLEITQMIGANTSSPLEFNTSPLTISKPGSAAAGLLLMLGIGGAAAAARRRKEAKAL